MGANRHFRRNYINHSNYFFAKICDYSWFPSIRPIRAVHFALKFLFRMTQFWTVLDRFQTNFLSFILLQKKIKHGFKKLMFIFFMQDIYNQGWAREIPATLSPNPGIAIPKSRHCPGTTAYPCLNSLSQKANTT